ncbi:DUF6230 family protein [Pueribacillus sp. YX66]|uniref:DUF6230 family protein n=1 Tax=Pueribacillus sp. YX66 TaxID=3229242 RepID=UPI00358CDF5A
MVNALNVNIKRFSFVAGAGTIGLIALLVTLLMSGTVFAAFPLAGIGGFTIEATKIKGETFELYPEIGPTEKKDPWMNAAIYIQDETNISNLKLIKNLNVSNALGEYGITDVDIIVSGSGQDISARGLRLKVTGLQSDDSLLKELNITEGTENMKGDKQPFLLAADQLELKNAALNSHYLSVGSIGIPGLKIQLVHNRNDGTSKGGF